MMNNINCNITMHRKIVSPLLVIHNNYSPSGKFKSNRGPYVSLFQLVTMTHRLNFNQS